MSGYLDRIGPQEFSRLIAELETVTEKLVPEKFQIYLDRLQHYDPADIRQAVRVLLDTYDFKSFPPLAKFFWALEQTAKRSSSASAEELQARYPCLKCHGGWLEAQEIWSGHVYDCIIPCDCKLGEWRRDQWKRIEARHHRAVKDAGTVFRIRFLGHGEWQDIIEPEVVRAGLGPRPGERVKFEMPPTEIDPSLQTDGPADEEEGIPF